MKYASLFHADPSIRYHGSSINRGNESNRCSSIFFLLLLIFIHVASFYIYIYIFRIYLSRKNQLFRIAMCKKVSTIYLKTKRDRSATEIEPSRFSYPRLELKFLITGLADVYAFMQNLKVEKKKGTGYDMQKNAKHSIIRGIRLIFI